MKYKFANDENIAIYFNSDENGNTPRYMYNSDPRGSIILMHNSEVVTFILILIRWTTMMAKGILVVFMMPSWWERFRFPVGTNDTGRMDRC